MMRNFQHLIGFMMLGLAACISADESGKLIDPPKPILKSRLPHQKNVVEVIPPVSPLPTARSTTFPKN